MKFYWNFQRGREVLEKTLPWGGIFSGTTQFDKESATLPFQRTVSIISGNLFQPCANFKRL